MTQSPSDPSHETENKITDPDMLEKFLTEQVDPETLRNVLKRMHLLSCESGDEQLFVTRQDHNDFRAFLGSNPEIRSTGRNKLEVMGRFLQSWGIRFRIRIVETA